MNWKIGDKCVWKHLSSPIVNATIQNIVCSKYGCHYVIEIVDKNGNRHIIDDAQERDLYKNEKEYYVHTSTKSLNFLEAKLSELDAERERTIKNINKHKAILEKYFNKE